MTAAEELKGYYIPLEDWGRDHWSTLAYFESVEVDLKSFDVVFDPRMRQNRRHFRIMPRKGRRGSVGIAMEPGTGSILRDGRYVPGHDDWNCVQDFAQAGLLTCGPEGVEPGNRLKLSDRGRGLAAKLRVHKAAGGSFANFTPA